MVLDDAPWRSWSASAVHHPELFARYVEIEARTGYTAHQSRKGLEEVAGLTVAQARAEHALFGAEEIS